VGESRGVAIEEKGGPPTLVPRLGVRAEVYRAHRYIRQVTEERGWDSQEERGWDNQMRACVRACVVCESEHAHTIQKNGGDKRIYALALGVGWWVPGVAPASPPGAS